MDFSIKLYCKSVQPVDFSIELYCKFVQAIDSGIELYCKSVRTGLARLPKLVQRWDSTG